MVNDCLLELQIEKSHGCFHSSYPWIKKTLGAIFCPHCHNVYESVKRLDAVVNNKEEKRESDVDLVFGYCGNVKILSTRFIDVVGPRLLAHSVGLGKVLNERGFEYRDHRTAVALMDNVVVRGSEDKATVRGRAGKTKSRNIGACYQCGRLLYWPIGGRYVIRQELPDWPAFLSDGHLFCLPEFFEKRLVPAKLRFVVTEAIPILDKPSDGLPASTAELTELLRAKRPLK